MNDIQPTDLRYFFEVSKTQNISRAAERLAIGQPALSQALRRLEHVVGARLFDRFKTGVQLTSAGRRLLEDGRPALEHWEKLKHSAAMSESEIVGSYSIGCHTAVALYTLPKFLRKLMEPNPGLEIVLKHGLSREVLEDVISFRSDFGLVMNPVRHPDLVIKNLADDEVTFWKTKDALKSTLIYDPSLSQVQKLLKAGTWSQPFKRHISSASLEVIAKLGAEGCGTVLLPARIAKMYPQLRRDSDAPSVKDKLALIYRADRKITEAARLIIREISQAQF